MSCRRAVEAGTETKNHFNPPGKSGCIGVVRKGWNSRFGWNSTEFTELLKRPGWNMLVKHTAVRKEKKVPGWEWFFRVGRMCLLFENSIVCQVY